MILLAIQYAEFAGQWNITVLNVSNAGMVKYVSYVPKRGVLFYNLESSEI